MAEIAVDAARKAALAAAGKTGAQVDARALCQRPTCSAPTRRWLSKFSRRMGAGGYGFDMNVACSSATFAIEQAANAVKRQQLRTACWW